MLWLGLAIGLGLGSGLGFGVVLVLGFGFGFGFGLQAPFKWPVKSRTTRGARRAPEGLGGQAQVCASMDLPG